MPDINEKLQSANDLHDQLYEHVNQLKQEADQVYDDADDIAKSALAAKTVRFCVF